MTWTILRTVTFMENLTDDIQGKGFATMWANVIGKKALQLVAAKDVGVFAARVLLNHDDPRSRNRAVGIAGHELTQAQASEVYRKVLGKQMPFAPCVAGKLVQWKIPEFRIMFEWFRDVGCGASVEECRTLYPGMLDLEGWLRETKSA